MKKIFLIVLAIFISSCNNNNDDNPNDFITLFGVYVEAQPLGNESHLIDFIDVNNFAISISNSNIYEGTYVLNSNSISLTYTIVNNQTCNSYCTDEFDIEIIDNSKFKLNISNFLYVSIPGNPLPNYILFEKSE
jgi:hypothetical protein